jgi:hypothetical protein
VVVVVVVLDVVVGAVVVVVVVVVVWLVVCFFFGLAAGLCDFLRGWLGAVVVVLLEDVVVTAALVPVDVLLLLPHAASVSESTIAAAIALLLPVFIGGSLSTGPPWGSVPPAGTSDG